MPIVRFQRASAAVKIAFAGVSTADSIYLGLVGAQTVHGHAVPVGLTVGSLAVMALGTSIRAALRDTIFRNKIAKKEESVRQMLHAAIFSVSKEAGIDVRKLTISLFLVTGQGRWQRLERWMRITFRPRTESTVRWTRGKGAIGQCWDTETVVTKNIEGTNSKWGECNRQDWEGVPEATRMGLTHEEWRKTAKKYDMIVAVPVHVDGRIVGCVALDGPANGSNWVEEGPVAEALEGAAATIATLDL